MNINNLMKQAKKMQEQMEKSKAKLAEQTFEVNKQGVKIVAMGNKEIESITIDEALMDVEDKDILEDLLIIAFNELIQDIEEAEAESQPQAPQGMPF